MTDVRNQPGYDPNQHCTYERQDGEDDYSFSHTAAYCGRPQPRFCGCAFCYDEKPQRQDFTRDELKPVIRLLKEIATDPDTPMHRRADADQALGIFQETT